MAVNNMTIEQANSLLASLHQQATGEAVATPTSLADFISVAQNTLLAGDDVVLGAITQMVTDTIISVRPYNRKFSGLLYDTKEYGGIIRKINFEDIDPEASSAYSLTDGASVDQYVVKKPVVLQTNYVGSNEWASHYSITRDQLKMAFESPQNLGEFFTGLMMHFSNQKEQWLEEMARASVCNYIAGKNVMNGSYDVIHLLTEYNTLTGGSFTAQTIRQPANFPGFMKWVYGRVSSLCDKMTERSELFQQVLTGHRIMRHTPLVDQRVYMLDEFLRIMEAEVLADTYHDNFLRYADVESVGYWQAIEDPDEVKVTPVYVDATGAPATGAAQTMANVIGVVFDRNAIGYNIYEDTMDASPYNARGSYYNLWYRLRIQYQNDFTEKGFVLVVD